MIENTNVRKGKVMTDLARYNHENDDMYGMSLRDLGTVLHKSGFFADTRDEAQAMVKVLAGRELGFGPIASMNGLHIVKGKVTIGANLMSSAVKRSNKYNYRVLVLNDQECSIEFFEAGQSAGVSTFTLADAKKAGTQNLDKFPRNMLFSRAMANGVRWFAPDTFDGPVYTPEEMGMMEQVSPLPPAPPANVITGEVVEDVDPAVQARLDAVAQMRASAKAAVKRGAMTLADLPTADVVQAMSLDEVRSWADAYDAMPAPEHQDAA